MSEYDSNPFVDPVDVNPFQVRLGVCVNCIFLFQCLIFMESEGEGLRPKTCLVGRLGVWPEYFLGRKRHCNKVGYDVYFFVPSRVINL